jgi:ADP-ribosyl-[dinitrogen reductase] hydrolase
MSDNEYLDVLLGYFYGACLGDSVGIPYEFTYGRIPYYYTSDGKVSDDTEMMLALFTCIVTNGAWKREKVIEAYTRWVGSGCFDVGVNTRQLFANGSCFPDKMVRMYEANIKAQIERPMHLWSQSNGCLMRCMPLLFCEESTRQADCELTNPHVTCVEAVKCYFMMIEQCIKERIQGRPRAKLTHTMVSSLDLQDAIKDALLVKDLTKSGQRNVSEKRGWVTHAIYFAAVMYHNEVKTMEEGLQFIIGCHLNSDTDTNACIAGALLGCKLGYEKLMKEENTSKMLTSILNYSSERPNCYHPKNIAEYIKSIINNS